MCRDLILNKNNAQTYKEHYGQQYKSLGNKWRNLTNLITGKQFTVKPPVSNLATKISSLCGYKTGSLMRPYWVCLIGSEVCPMFKCPIYVNSQFQEKNLKLPLRNFCLLYFPGMWCYNTVSNFHSIIGQVVAYGSLKTRKQSKFEIISSESGHGCLRELATCKRWELLVHCKTGHWGEVVATGRSTFVLREQ